MKIHLVFGSTGEYSDRSEWVVAAYTDEDMAKEHVRLASENARGRELRDYDERQVPPNPYDPGMWVDYTGTIYYLGSAILRSELPQP